MHRVNSVISSRLILTITAFLLAGSGFAQYGNEWIKFNQQYFKIPVAKEGIYRLNYTDLQNAGFPVSSADPRRIQVFHRGVEQRIIVEGEGNAVFNPTDYIEFYGRGNDGVSDTELYKPTSTQPHQYYNLYTDTTAYFLTLNSLAQLGLRMESFSEINVTGIQAEIFHQDQKFRILTTQYATGKKYNTYVQNTFFETGEGWTGDQIIQNQFIDYGIDNILNTSQSSGSPQLEIQLVGRAEVLHQVEISVGSLTPSRVIATESFSASNVVTVTSALNWSDIGGDGRMVVRVKALGVSGAADRLSASYVKIEYPQSFNQVGTSEKVFHLNEKVGNKSYIEIQNPPAGTRLFDVTDPANVVPIGTTLTTTLNAVIPNTALSRTILATNSFTTPSIHSVTFRNIDPSLHDYIIISHRLLMKPAGAYSDAIEAYANYRASAVGGSYDTLVAEINQLYDQFNYGEKSPLAISRFMKFMVSLGNPRYLLIIGKGLDVWHNYHRNPSAFTYHDLVPSAGMPASDILFTAGLNGTVFEPAVATGRITASTPQDVVAYLNKVKEMEALPFNDLWRKELLHLSGGIYPGEPEQFASYMRQFGTIAESYYLGGNVSSIGKSSTEIEFINISDKVNSGVNLITLFGHSSPSQNDFNIGFVSAPELGYNNPGKYPMFLINGCNAGDFFSTITRYGEDWINTPGKGALGFMANTSFGYSSLLRAYSDTFYSVAYGDSSFLDKGIGDIQKEVVQRLTNISQSVLYVTQGQQMFLLGDPAVKLFGASKPDYEINDNYVYPESYNSEPVTALSDSFAIKMIVRNFGRAKEDSIAVRVVRTLNDNSSITYDSIFYPVLYRDTLTFTIYKEDQGFGNNRFSITIDPLNAINEIEKSNNTAELTMFIPLNASRNLYPQGFSIVNTATLNLVVQGTDVVGEGRDFILQIDTVDTFDSPYAQEFTVNGKIATKEINLIVPSDTLAYYWRSRFAQKQNDSESIDWATTSFTYIENGSEGWAQVHFPQYLSNETIRLVKDPAARLLRLEETITDVSIRTFGADHPSPHTAVSIKLNNTEYNPISLPELQCRDNTINLIAFGKTSTVPYVAIPVQYPDPKACGRRPEVITSFLSTEVETGNGKDIIQYIDNVPAGDSVVLFSIGDPGYASWSANVQNKLSELGISLTQIAALQVGEAVIIFSKKGSAIGSATIIKTLPTLSLTADGTITGRYVSGTMTSAVIGPAVDWGSFKATGRVSELPVTDQFNFDVIGKTLEGVATVLKPGLTASGEDLSDINAATHPYLQLVFHAADEINLTSPQLKKWLVEYTPAPEGVLTFDGSLETKLLKEGEIWTGTYGFYNISEKQFSDSLNVQYTIYNTTSRTSEISTKKIKAPAPGQETLFDIVVNTKEKAGLNDVKVFVNPRVLPEVYYDNNVLELKDHLNVAADRFNPILDVTIDGRYILNGDYVSPSPVIVVKVWDENSLLLKRDTIGIDVFLKYPCASEGCPFTKIYFSNPDVRWFPATDTSDFMMDFKPENLPEGLYTLQVMARDVRNNSSGVIPYEINFVVAENNTVTIQRPYPNPSSDIFFFNIVVAGDAQPDAMYAEIINTNGLAVRKFVKKDFYTGTNIVSIGGGDWPVGLYFYRIALFKDGKKIKTSTGKIIRTR